MANKDANYYLARAQEIRRRGGNEALARQMENYANNLMAGIYDDTTAAWTPPATPAPAAAPTAAPAERAGGSTRKSSSSRPVQAPPVQHVISPNPQLTQGILPRVGAYMDYPAYANVQEAGMLPEDGVPVVQDDRTPRHTGLLRSLENFKWGNISGIPRRRRPEPTAADGALPQVGAYTDYPAYANAQEAGMPPEDGVPVVQDDRTPRHTGLLRSLENFKWGNISGIPRRRRPEPTAAESVLPQTGTYTDVPVDANVQEAGMLPEMVAEAQRVPRYANKPSGGSDLTYFYAQQLRGSKYEANEGKDGIHYGDSGLVNRMRDLHGIIPYNESDGTNCARTVSVALDGTPYSGMLSVGELVSTAKNQGQLINPRSGYVPQAGDLAVTDGGQHVVMVTESGGTIQNGQSHNGVYESSKPPSRQKGGVQYYIRTSDYNNAFPSFHADLSPSEWNFDEPFSMDNGG